MSTPAAIPTKSLEAPRPAHHFDDYQQQYDACVLGMWVFLVTEIMFFGGLFITYAVYRSAAPEAFAAASRQLDLALGTVNTTVLLTSSLTMALAVRDAYLGRFRGVTTMLIATMVLGAVFLGIKFYEYAHKYHEGLVPLRGLPFRAGGSEAHATQLFYALYFAMTGVHAIHMILGIGIIAIVLYAGWRQRTFGQGLRIEVVGLYWHFVDVVWILLFPLLYLIDRSR